MAKTLEMVFKTEADKELSISLAPSIHQCNHRLWYDLRHLNGRY